MKNSLVAGVDIGGSHITIALVDLVERVVLNHTWKRARIDSMGNAQDIIDSWCKVITDCFQAQGMAPTSLGIAMPGPFDYEEGISLMKNQNKYDALYGLNIKEILSQKLEIPASHIKITNDAACYLQGEVFSGAAKDCDHVIGLTLGTGLGSARSVNNVAEDADLWCSSFKGGIAEDYLSTRWFIRRYYELTGNSVKDVKELADSVGENPIARQIFEEFGTNLGMFLTPLIKSEGFEIVVLGGNISNAFALFSGSLEKVFQANHIEVEIKRSVLGEQAALIGAASCCSAGVVHLDVA